MQPTIVIGLVGGIGSGKSTVAKFIASQNGLVIDADQIGHQLLHQKNIINRLLSIFGESILNSEASICRRELARVVFESPQADASRKQLEDVLHPAIHQEAVKQLREAKEQGSYQWIVVDAPLLLEAGWKSLCDAIWFIDTPSSQRLSAVAKRGWDADELSRRERTQWSLEQKKASASRLIRNDGDLQHLAALVSEALADESKRASRADL